MSLKQTTFEGTTAGDTLTATNGGAGNTPFTIGTTTGTPSSIYSSVTPIHGTRCWHLDCAAGTRTRIYYADPLTSSFSVAFGYRPVTQPTVQAAPIYSLIESGTFNQALSIIAGTAGAVTVRNAGSVSTTMSGVTLATGTAYRFEAWGSLAGTPTTSNATYTVACYAGDSTTALGSVVVNGTGNLGTVGFIQNAIGKFDTNGTLDSIFDDFRSNLGSANPFGPLDLSLSSSHVLSPTSGVVPVQTTATISYTGGTGTPVTYAMNWGDGSTTAAQSSNTMTHTYTVAGTYTTTATVLNT